MSSNGQYKQINNLSHPGQAGTKKNLCHGVNGIMSSKIAANKKNNQPLMEAPLEATKTTASLILAAGRGSRMKEFHGSKTLLPLIPRESPYKGDRPIILEILNNLPSGPKAVVVNHRKEDVINPRKVIARKRQRPRQSPVEDHERVEDLEQIERSKGLLLSFLPPVCHSRETCSEPVEGAGIHVF